ncbi:MAG: xanthine dehydrogenase family protein subunit M [Anaerolineae bacterium]|nr:xanthine dehydrogenase family protein subunit M [Anaerolineae bacterium]
MKPAAFEYLAPESLQAALAAKAEYGDDAKPLAGGQSLIPAMNFRVTQPTMLIDLNKISELDFITQINSELHIGAMTRQSAVESSHQVAESSPLLAETMPNIAHVQIRNRGTFGGSLAHADPAAELPVVALALDARFKAQSANGERWMKAEEFFQGMFTVDLTPEELLTEIAFPAFPEHTGWAFMEIARRKGDYAMAGVAALITLDDAGKCKKARMVYLNVGDGPVDAKQAASTLQGEEINAKSIQAAAQTAVTQEIMPFGNIHASPDYQSHLTRILTVRALELAHTRAQQ